MKQWTARVMLALSIVLFLLFGFPSASVVNAYVTGGVAKAGVTPSTATIPTGQTATMDVYFNTNNEIISVVQLQVFFSVPSTPDLEVVQVQPNTALTGWTFSVYSHKTEGGKTTIDLAALPPFLDGYRTSADTKLATVVLKATAPFTNKSIQFTQSLSKITRKSDAVDILGTLATATYQASGGGSVQNTPTPTPTPQQGSDTQQSGTVSPTCLGLTTNITTATGVPQTITLVCNGRDTDGDITAAEFTFGDGSKQLVTQTVGASGTISVSHTYTQIGSLGASCRVRDNNQLFSSVPESCKKIISLRPASSTGGQTVLPSPTTAPLTAPMEEPLAVEPTFEPVVPMEQPSEAPLYANEPTKAGGFPWLAGGLVAGALLGAFILFRVLKGRQASPNAPTNTAPPPMSAPPPSSGGGIMPPQQPPQAPPPAS